MNLNIRLSPKINDSINLKILFIFNPDKLCYLESFHIFAPEKQKNIK